MTATHDLDQAAQYFDRIMLLNKRLIRFGYSEDVLSPENLKTAYGGRMHYLEGAPLLAALDDACSGCEGGEEA